MNKLAMLKATMLVGIIPLAIIGIVIGLFVNPLHTAICVGVFVGGLAAGIVSVMIIESIIIPHFILSVMDLWTSMYFKFGGFGERPKITRRNAWCYKHRIFFSDSVKQRLAQEFYAEKAERKAVRK